MAIKIDLEKAYDRIEWSFIREILFLFNFPDKLIELIMSCVSSVSTSLLFNGGCLESFCPSRGIRQGDPLSPYLFILCMEFLGHLIEDKCAAKVWKPVKTSRNGPSFSHLFFADDLVLFAEANTENCLAIRDVLQEFCSKSGQKVSEAKSRVFFLLMWILIKASFCLVRLVSALQPILENIWVFLLSTQGPVGMILTMCWIELRKSLRGGKLTYSPWLAGWFSSMLLPPPFRTM